MVAVAAQPFSHKASFDRRKLRQNGTFLYDNNMALAADCSFIRFDVQTVVNCCVYLCLLLLRAFLFPFC